MVAEEIDSIISAKIPDKDSDPIGYEVVGQFMMHGPCGEANPRCPCMVHGKCTKYYPKPYTNNTTMDSDGYASYRRRDVGRTVECNKILLDNRPVLRIIMQNPFVIFGTSVRNIDRPNSGFDSIIAYVFHVLHKHVVPYNRGLLVKYQAHINVERCNRLKSIKYLFKYIGKGPDKVTAVMERVDGASTVIGTSTSILREKQLDEVKNYLSYRYLSSAEACWRIFEFSIHHREPYVQRLFFHLEDEHEVRFRDDDSLPEILGRIRPHGTIFVQWVLNNRRDESGRDLIFVRYLTRYRWDNAGKFWARHKQNIDVVG
ncbi:hypothetical protein AgCh_019599 [Apium graveolens]